MPDPLVVCIFGEIGAGKSALAAILSDGLNVIEVKGRGVTRQPKTTLAPVYGFTRPIKDHVAETFGLSKGDRGWRRTMHRAARSLPPGVTMTNTTTGWAVALADLSRTERRETTEYLWFKRWEEQVAELFPDARYVIADDARTEYEFAEAKRWVWLTVLVTGRRRHSSLHPDYWLPTERSVRRLARRHREAMREVRNDVATGRTPREGALRVCFDWTVVNDGGPNLLQAEARRLADDLKNRAMT